MKKMFLGLLACCLFMTSFNFNYTTIYNVEKNEGTSLMPKLNFEDSLNPINNDTREVKELNFTYKMIIMKNKAEACLGPFTYLNPNLGIFAKCPDGLSPSKMGRFVNFFELYQIITNCSSECIYNQLSIDDKKILNEMYENLMIHDLYKEEYSNPDVSDSIHDNHKKLSDLLSEILTDMKNQFDEIISINNENLKFDELKKFTGKNGFASSKIDEANGMFDRMLRIDFNLGYDSIKEYDTLTNSFNLIEQIYKLREQALQEAKKLGRDFPPLKDNEIVEEDLTYITNLERNTLLGYEQKFSDINITNKKFDSNIYRGMLMNYNDFKMDCLKKIRIKEDGAFDKGYSLTKRISATQEYYEMFKSIDEQIKQIDLHDRIDGDTSNSDAAEAGKDGIQITKKIDELKKEYDRNNCKVVIKNMNSHQEEPTQDEFKLYHECLELETQIKGLMAEVEDKLDQTGGFGLDLENKFNDLSADLGSLSGASSLDCSSFEETLAFVRTAYVWLTVIAFGITVILSIMDFVKALAASDADKRKQAISNFMKRIAIFVCLLFVAIVYNVLGELFFPQLVNETCNVYNR